jgi:hypothetical protein
MVADNPPRSTPRAASQSPSELSDTFELVKQYAKQETLGPLRGAGKWIAFGAAGALSLAAGGLLIVLGVLRLIQNEFGPTFSGRWMGLLPYAVALLVSVAIIAVAISRISKSSLHRD